jgi:rare lipoprotein A
MIMKSKVTAYIPFLLLIMALQLSGCQTSSTYTSVQGSVPLTSVRHPETPSGQNTSGEDDESEEMGAPFLVAEGKASFYADRFHGRLTANGERFNMYALTAAHKSLPFGSIVKVTNLDNGKEVVVRINDRGPFIKGRVIDLSLEAAKEIDMIRDGVTKVRLEAYETGTEENTQAS